MSISQEAYRNWVEAFDDLKDEGLAAARRYSAALPVRTTFDVLMPVHDPDPAFLAEAVESVRNQIYDDWRLWVVDDASTRAGVRDLLERSAVEDARIHVSFAEKNGGIASATNAALAPGRGEFVAFMDHDDRIAPHALLCMADRVARNRDASILYSDFDFLDEQGNRKNPFFKPDYDHELHLGLNFVTHLTVYRRTLLERLGGLREGYSGSEDYDLSLRAIESADMGSIHHVPHILYHWRIVPSSFSRSRSLQALEGARKAVLDHCARAGIEVTVTGSPRSLIWNRVRASNYKQSVALVAEAGEASELMRLKESCLAVAHSWTHTSLPSPALRNEILSRAEDDAIAFADARLVPRSHDWLLEMSSSLAFPGCAAVGARILGPDARIVHAGLLLGVGSGADGIGTSAFAGVSDAEANYFGRAELCHRATCVTGGVVLFRQSALREIGGFDELLDDPLAMDIDVCLRLRKKGWSVVVCPHAVFGDLRAMLPAMTPRSIAMLRAKWGEELARDPFYSPNLSAAVPDFSLAFPPRTEFPWA